jgi:hypothetical protein
MSTMDRFKLRNKYAPNDITVGGDYEDGYGDAFYKRGMRSGASDLYMRGYSQASTDIMGETSAADAGLYSGIFSELAKGVGGIAQQTIASKEAKKKEQEQKALTADAEAKRREATIAMNEARIAQAQAGTDPNKLVAAQRKLDAANLLDQDARKLEMKAGALPTGMMTPYEQQPRQSSGRPWYFYAMIGVGALGIGYVGYKAFTSARTAPSK